jgi:hypothetical protein
MCFSIRCCGHLRCVVIVTLHLVVSCSGQGSAPRSAVRFSGGYKILDC